MTVFASRWEWPNVQDIPVPVDRPPQILRNSSSRSYLSPGPADDDAARQRSLTELTAPLGDRFILDHDTAGHHHLLDLLREGARRWPPGPDLFQRWIVASSTATPAREPFVDVAVAGQNTRTTAPPP